MIDYTIQMSKTEHLCSPGQDMYFKYIWNNFLHIQVEICTAMILAMPPAPTEVQPESDQGPARESTLITHVRPLKL